MKRRLEEAQMTGNLGGGWVSDTFAQNTGTTINWNSMGVPATYVTASSVK